MTISHLIRQTVQTHYHHYTYRSYEGFFPPSSLYVHYSLCYMKGPSSVRHTCGGAGCFMSSMELLQQGVLSLSMRWDEDTTVQLYSLMNSQPWSHIGTNTKTRTHETAHTHAHTAEKKCGTYSLLAQGWYNDQLNKEKSKLLLPEVMINKERERERSVLQ